jgi:uncharacterized cupredoxin-like copper-binding protein
VPAGAMVIAGAAAFAGPAFGHASTTQKATAKIGCGKSTNLTVTLKKGKYPYSSTIPGHAAAGMKGTLVVR